MASISLSWIGQFSLVSTKVFKQYIIGCYSLSSCFQEKTPAIVPSKASVSSIKGRSRQKQASRGAKISRSLSLLKAFLHTALKLKGQSFLVRQFRGQAILLQFFIKHQQKLQKPKNNYTPFTVHNSYYQLITAIFSGSALILSILIINPKYFIRLILNSNFLILAQRLASRSQYSTLQTYSLYSILF